MVIAAAGRASTPDALPHAHLMRLPVTAAAALAAVTAFTAPARAQVVGQYALSGCFDGILRWEPTADPRQPAPVFGRIACFGGTATLDVVPLTGGGFPAGATGARLDGALTADISPEFTGAFVGIFALEAAAVDVPQVFWSLLRVRTFVPGAPAPIPFQSISAPLPAGVDPSALGRIAAIAYVEIPTLPNDPAPPGRQSYGVPIIFTPIPEPATAALTAAGLAAAAAVGRRRRGAGGAS